MIRINLLGQARPKAAKKSLPLEATMQVIFLIAALGVAAPVVLGIVYYQQKNELDAVNAHIASLRAEKASLEQIKQQVDQFEAQKGILQQRIDVIETLQRNRSGAQDLLQMVANTVVRVDALWLTTLNRTGDSIDMEGTAGSINSVANFITQLKRSGYFDSVEIKSAAENDIVPTVQTYQFSMSAAVAAANSSQPKTQPTAATTPATPGTAPRGRS